MQTTQLRVLVRKVKDYNAHEVSTSNDTEPAAPPPLSAPTSNCMGAVGIKVWCKLEICIDDQMGN